MISKESLIKELPTLLIVFLITIIFFMVGVTFLALLSVEVGIQVHRTESSCEDIGMEYYTTMDTKFCVDTSGNAHYVKIDCNGILWNKVCTAQIISIGDVRVR